MSSTLHQVAVVPVALEPHPNADSLSIVRVGGWTVCVRTVDWQGKELGAYIPPDNVVPDRPEFAFLDGHRRIRARKLRGVVSHGLLMPAPQGSKVGDDVTAALGVIAYEPPADVLTGGVRAPSPQGHWPKYDIEPWEKWSDHFTECEPVFIHEKIHGTSWRGYVDPADGTLSVGSRAMFLQRGPESDAPVYWEVLKKHPEVVEWLTANPGLALHGEVYGWVQELRYGHTKGTVSLILFDVFDPVSGHFLDYPEAREKCRLPNWVPLLSSSSGAPVPLVKSAIRTFANGKTTVAGVDHIREGCVIRPARERRVDGIGRVILKCIGDDYLMS